MSKSNHIHILIVDDNTIVRQGLLALIDTATDMKVVGEATDIGAAVLIARESQPDVIILDPSLPMISGSDAIRALADASRYGRILLLTSINDDQRVLAALRAGAQGYLLKDALLTDILKAIRDIHDGKMVLHPSVTHVLMQAIHEPRWAPTKTAASLEPHLTEREQDILRLIARGMTNRTIADMLQINERTVRLHTSHILRKLNVESRTQAALFALRQEMVALDE